MKELQKSAKEHTTTDEMLIDNGIIPKIENMPPKLHGYTQPIDDIYLLWINTSISNERKWNVLQHELSHIANNDFDRNDPVEIIEEENEY